MLTIEHAVDLARNAIFLSLLLCAPVLLMAMLVGLLISVLQAVTQIQDQTISFVPKIVVMLLTSLFAMPWAIQQMVEYSTILFRGIAGP
jgi:flagellar biosynthetic protein FliQ